jgi:hypothetical protein
MMAWLPVVVLAVVQITVRLIRVAAMIWQERTRADARCAEMRTASANGVILLEWQKDGTGLAIVPRDLVSRSGDAAAGRGPEEAPVA